MSSAEHFEGLLNSTIKRLENLCKEWQKFLDEDADKKCPEDVACEIMSALGKTNLLLNSKLPQFRHLVEELSRGQYGQRPIKPEDLQGFWDLVGLEISDVDGKFDNLNKRKALDWAPLPEIKPEIKSETPKKVLRNGSDRIDGKVKNFDHLRDGAKSRLALAKAKMQEARNMKKDDDKTENGKNDDKTENGIQCTISCTAKDRDLNRVSIC